MVKLSESKIIEINDPNYLFKCSCCKILKPNFDFGKKGGSRRKRLYHARCKVCMSEFLKVSGWGVNNPEKRKLIQKKYNLSHKKELQERSIAWKMQSPFKAMLGTYRQNAAKRNLILEITHIDLESLWEKQCGLCFYTKLPMLKHYGSKESVSIDRVDSSKGYLLDNVVLCRRQVNIMKNDATLEELFDFCESILNNKINILKL